MELPYKFGAVATWQRFNELSTLFVQLRNGDTVINTANPAVVAGYTFTQDTASEMPVLTENGFQGRFLATFNSVGSEQLSAGNQYPADTNGHFTVYIFGKHANQDNQMYVAKHTGGTDGSFFIGRPSSANVGRITFALINDSSNRVTLTTGENAFPDGQFQIITCRYDGATMEIFRNGVSMISTSQTGALKNSDDAVILGNYTSADWPLEGAIGEILMYKGAHENWVIQRVVTYLRQQWGYWDT